MKGYYVPSGYMGFDPISNSYILFATEEEYAEFMRESYFAPNFSIDALDNRVAMR